MNIVTIRLLKNIFPQIFFICNPWPTGSGKYKFVTNLTMGDEESSILIFDQVARNKNIRYSYSVRDHRTNRFDICIGIQ